MSPSIYTRVPGGERGVGAGGGARWGEVGLFSVRRLFGGGGLSVPPVGVGAFFAAVCGGLRRFGSKFVLNRPWGVTAGDGARFVDSPGHRVLCCDTGPGKQKSDGVQQSHYYKYQC